MILTAAARARVGTNLVAQITADGKPGPPCQLRALRCAGPFLNASYDIGEKSNIPFDNLTCWQRIRARVVPRKKCRTPFRSHASLLITVVVGQAWRAVAALALSPHTMAKPEVAA